MLVLTRKSEEQIIIGDRKEIVITILKIQGDKVSIGIEADRNKYHVYRKELLDQHENDVDHKAVCGNIQNETQMMNLNNHETEQKTFDVVQEAPYPSNKILNEK